MIQRIKNKSTDIAINMFSVNVLIFICFLKTVYIPQHIGIGNKQLKFKALLRSMNKNDLQARVIPQHGQGILKK